MSLLKQTKYLNYTQLKDTGKTIVVGVGNNFREKLGIISWYAPWRRYVYNPMDKTLYDVNCMKDIVEFIEGLMFDRKK